MRPSFQLLQKCRITLFTRANCSLCTDAKHTLSSVWDTRPFKFREVDVMAPDQTMWRDLYEFDVPVVCFAESYWRETANWSRYILVKQMISRRIRICQARQTSSCIDSQQKKSIRKWTKQKESLLDFPTISVHPHIMFSFPSTKDFVKYYNILIVHDIEKIKFCSYITHT